MNIGPSFLGGIVAGAMLLVVNVLLPDPPFIVVREITYSNGNVTFDRAIRQPDTVADWSVIVVEKGEGEPTCEGGGWGEYRQDESTRKVMSLDAFVGDTGCGVRVIHGLKNGKEYTAYANWSPRDGRRPVLHQFEITGDE